MMPKYPNCYISDMAITIAYMTLQLIDNGHLYVSDYSDLSESTFRRYIANIRHMLAEKHLPQYLVFDSINKRYLLINAEQNE